MDAGRAVLRRRAIQSRSSLSPPSARRELIAPRYLRRFATLFTAYRRTGERNDDRRNDAASQEKRWANKTASRLRGRGERGIKIDRDPYVESRYNED